MRALPLASFPSVSRRRGPSCCLPHTPSSRYWPHCSGTPPAPYGCHFLVWGGDSSKAPPSVALPGFSWGPSKRGARPPGSGAPSSRYPLHTPALAPGSPAPPAHLCSEASGASVLPQGLSGFVEAPPPSFFSWRWVRQHLFSGVTVCQPGSAGWGWGWGRGGRRHQVSAPTQYLLVQPEVS